MAGLEGAHPDEGYANTGGPKDGPVLTMMSKRLRALKKKYNRILQIEDSKAQGKAVNREQEEVLKTKIAVAALIDEYEKLRQPLLVAVKEEVAEREKELLAATLEREDEEGSVTDEKVEVRSKEAGAAVKEADGGEKEDETNGEVEEIAPAPPAADHSELANGFVNGGAELQEVEVVEAESEIQVEDREEESLSSRGTVPDGPIRDLLTLLYFSQLLGLKPSTDQKDLWTKVHERMSCLSYDYVRDEATKPLIEPDLDILASFGYLLTSRPVNVTVSHKESLEKSLEHAKAWLAASDLAIEGLPLGLPSTTYGDLRERLSRILRSEYFTMTPEIQTVNQQTAAEAAATAAGQYMTNVLVHEGPVMGSVSSERVIEEPVYLQDASVSAQFFQPREFVPAVPVVVANGIGVPSPLMAVANSAPFVPETIGAAIDVVPQFGSTEDIVQETSDTDAVRESDSDAQGFVQQQAQPQNQNFHPGGPRSGGYQRGRHGYGGRGRGGGYQNGRGGRGGRGGYPNGRGDRQFYDQGGQGGFYPPRQNYFGGGNRGGRGSRGGGVYNSYNAQSNGPAQPTMVATPAAVAAGSS